MVAVGAIAVAAVVGGLGFTVFRKKHKQFERYRSFKKYRIKICKNTLQEIVHILYNKHIENTIFTE